MGISGFPIASGNNGGGTVTNRYAGEWDLSVGNTVPNDAADGKVYEIVGANGVYLGNELNQGDFVEFADNLQKLIVISKPKTTTQIEQIAQEKILVDLQSNTSDIYTGVSGIATIGVIDTVNSAITNNQSDTYSFVKQASVDAFAIEMANNMSTTYSSVYGTATQAITDEIQTDCTIYNAIAQYVSDSTTGAAGHTIIQSAIEASLDNYANAIGVGNNGQPYLNVIEAAQAAISNEVQIGGIIETEIQTVAQSAISYEIQSGGTIDTAIQAAINP